MKHYEILMDTYNKEVSGEGNIIAGFLHNMRESEKPNSDQNGEERVQSAKLEEKVETYQVHSKSRLEKPQDFDFKRVLPESARLYSSMLHSSKI